MYFNVTILDKSGTFEITESNATVASGKVYTDEDIKFCEPEPQVDRESSTFVSGEDLYNELRIHGYQYGPAFRKLVETSLNGTEGFVEWDNNWITLMDALLLFFMFKGDLTSFMLPTGALSFKIAPKILKEGFEMSLAKKLPGLPVTFHKDSKICRTAGLEVVNLEVDAAPQRAKPDDCILEEYKFVPYVQKYKPLTHSETLEKYKVACNKVIEALESKTARGCPDSKFNTKTGIDVDLESYMEEEEDGHHQLLLALKQVSGIKTDADQQQLKDIFRAYVQNAGKDIANNLLVNDYCLRYMFDVVSENSFKKLSVLEVRRNFDAVLPTAVEVVEKNSMLKFKSKIFVADGIDDADRENLGDLNIQIATQESLASTAPDGSQSVVISAICINTEKEARQHLSLLSRLVEQKGFVLLFHKNSILPPERLLASLLGETVNVIPHTVLEGWFAEENLMVVSKITDELDGNLYLLRRADVPEDRDIVRVSEDAKWFDELKSNVCDSSKTSWVVSEGNPSSGIIGMINCLRHEPGGDKIRCVFIPEKNKEVTPLPNFNFEDGFFQDVLKKDLVMNAYKDGTWGSFRHVRIEKELREADVNYSFVNIKKYGDLSSLTWMQSALEFKETTDIVHIYYSALNFRDVMLATGKISTRTAAVRTDVDNCILGLEFSGRTKTGERIAGMCANRGLATCQVLTPETYFSVPDDWSLEEAATIPVVYITCYYALIMRARLQPGESVLIHSGTGGVGQAAINIARSMNCEIYTTVGTEEKRQYLLENFSCIQSENIGSSRDASFEEMVLRRTKGRGVDVVLNSLADDKFIASLRCVARNGRFVEIGKYDLAMDRGVDLAFFLKNITIHGVFLDTLLLDGKMKELRHILKLLKEGVRTGVVRPLKRTVFQRQEVEKAFRYMAGGTHIGKVLVKIRDEENCKRAPPKMLTFSATPATYFYPNKVYIVVGGLGGFGIEVSKWVLAKGAKNLVLTTRYGARTPYHEFCLKRWRDQGYNVVISKRDVSIAGEAANLLKEVSEIGPVGGIFNSAVVLHDAFLENTNWDHFKEVCAPKADATMNLDDLSRFLCPELDHFVCFSSISCGKGNAGQMNYGYANSVMERVCERRRADGLPGLAIQWGIIGEVGVVHRHMGDDAMIAGVGAQKVKSCLNILDVACQMKRPVVCSYVIKDSSTKEGDGSDVMQQLAKIFGLKDPSEFNTMRSFSEMGVDSLMGVEVKHLLESNCDTTFTMKELQDLKIDDVKALLEKAESQRKSESQPQNTLMVSTVSCVSLPRSCVHSQAVERLNDVHSGVPVFIVDIDSENTSLIRKLSTDMNQPVFALLLSKDAPTKNIESLASWFLERITEITQEDVHLVAYSSASAVAFEIVLQLQKSGSGCRSLIFLDGSDNLLKIANKKTSSDAEILCGFVESYIASPGKMLRENLSKVKTLDQQIRIVVELFTKTSNQAVDKAVLTGIVNYYVKKVKLLEAYEPKENLVCDILVIEDSCRLLANDVAEVKMLLSEICSGKVTIQRMPEISDLSEDSIQRLNATLKSSITLDMQPIDKPSIIRRII